MNSNVKEVDSENEKSQVEIGDYLCRKRELDTISMDDEDEFHAKQRKKGLRNECLDQMQTDTNHTTLCVSKMIEKHNKICLKFKEEDKKMKQLAQEQKEMFLEFQEKMKNEFEISKKEHESWSRELKAYHELIREKLNEDIQKINTLTMKLLESKPLGRKNSDENALRFVEDDKKRREEFTKNLLLGREDSNQMLNMVIEDLRAKVQGVNNLGNENKSKELNEALKNKLKELNEELQQKQNRITYLKEQNQILLIKDRMNMEELQKVREELIKINSSN